MSRLRRRCTSPRRSRTYRNGPVSRSVGGSGNSSRSVAQRTAPACAERREDLVDVPRGVLELHRQWKVPRPRRKERGQPRVVPADVLGNAVEDRARAARRTAGRPRSARRPSRGRRPPSRASRLPAGAFTENRNSVGVAASQRANLRLGGARVEGVVQLARPGSESRSSAGDSEDAQAGRVEGGRPVRVREAAGSGVRAGRAWTPSELASRLVG